ncbi:MAG: alpha-E domain-containing protein [Muribaculaceae bacterium]|nr:alpha-E domain-containing protein [Roseburia sp.]MCM1431387.1 alpha-E domain-containing protein [Muribaculaceae bacterium]MCM1491829.1 alpha-E domain-containing protein [Muribaculaceae bacterium]
MGIISVEQADHLFWLGRYTERVYTTLRLYFLRFDSMIDEAADSYQAFCASVDIPNIYLSKEDFLKRYPFDAQNPDSIISNLNRAYDNAIVLRESIGSEALSYIQLAVYDMNKAAASQAPLIELQYLLDHILSFWGVADDQIDSEQVRNMIKAGKRIERIDMYARLKKSKEELVREVCRMIPRVERSGLTYDRASLEEVKRLVENPDLDYYKIVSNVEAVI